jgi:DNA-binding MarR family transcriptional regulator
MMDRDRDAGRSDAHNPASEKKMPRYDVQILQSLRKIIRAADMYSRKLADGHDITGPQLVCLLAVVEEETTTTKALARRIHLSASTVVGILDRLEKKGFVKRLRDTVDRRVVNVMSTGAGRELAENAPSPLQDGLAGSLKRLPESEQATIALSLERIVKLMSADDIDATPILETGNIDQSVSERKSLADPNAKEKTQS